MFFAGPAICLIICKQVASFHERCIVSCMAITEDERKSASSCGGSRRLTDALRRELLAETDRYLAELIEEVGEPSPAEAAEAEVWCDRISRHFDKVPVGAQDDGNAASVGPDGDACEQDARERADRYLAELIEGVGEPSLEEAAEAEAWAARIESALEKARAAQRVS